MQTFNTFRAYVKFDTGNTNKNPCFVAGGNLHFEIQSIFKDGKGTSAQCTGGFDFL